MASYLETYGATEEHRAKRIHLIKNAAIVVVSVIAVALIAYAIFKNRSEEQQAKTFVSLLQAHDYQGAYRLWGCSDAHPCQDYRFDKFMEDWGPKSTHANQSTAKIGLSQSCGSGVVIRLDYQGSEEPVTLDIERGTKVISFAPWAECPGRHLHIGAWLRSLFNR
ncbi:MAG TPA: hypothetical protein VNV82_20365 [Bryobacteraceae bacterium]|nr:hypothetical protein [Bryobacteraceae bacterium]